MATHDTKKTPDWLIERLALGELDDVAAAGVRARLAAEGRDVDAAVAAIAASNREILETLPPARVAQAVRERASRARGARRGSWLFGLPVLAAGVAALVLVARPAPQATTGQEIVLESTGIRIKGDPELNVYRRRGESSERLGHGARAARGDLLQLAYRSGQKGNFGALLSIDGRGNVTVHWPEGNGGTSARLSAKGEIKLPSSYELDDAPAFERFFLVTSESPFAMSFVLEPARALASRPAEAAVQGLALPASFTQISLTVRKETP
jgi:hypothetical protein